MAYVSDAPGEKSAMADVDVERTNGVPESQYNKEEGIMQEHPTDSDEENAHKQDGVREVEGITSAWEWKTLWLMMVLLYLASFSDMLLVSIQTNLNPYITSTFQQHGLSSTVSIIATILGGTSGLSVAKIIDIWGRPVGFLFMLLLDCVGNIIKATCQNMESYVAGHTLYWIGHLNLLFCIDIMLADMTSLRNRMLILGINQTPTIATTFAGPKIADLFWTHGHFRWAFGAFTIILVAFCAPAAIVMLWNQRRAEKSGLIKKRADSGRKWYESMKFYIIELDLIGILLITAGWALLLLPFSLAVNTGKGWHSASMICMIVFGVVGLVLFGVWETWLAPVQFLPWKYLKERTIIGACLLYGIMFISVFTWDAYYMSYLQVVHDLSITNAGYVLNAFSLMSTFIAPLVGVLIRYTGDFKWTSYCGIPLYALGTGLLAHFRRPGTDVGYLVMCQIFVGAGTGIFAACGQLGLMAAVTHQEIAVVMAVFSLFGSIGAAIGNAIAGAIWTNVLPGELLKALPADKQDLMPQIYGSLSVQQEWPMGDPIRDAIIEAYGVVQHKMVIGGAVIVPVFVGCIFLFKNINVIELEEKKGKQTKGKVW